MIDEKIFQIGRALLAETDIQSMSTIALDKAIELSGAERGLIVLFKKNKMHFQTARHLHNTDMQKPEFEISKSIIDTVKKSAEAICLKNALKDSEFGTQKSVMRLGILSVICVPLLHNDSVFGVLYLDNRSVRGVFKKEICELFLNQFADFISLALYKSVQQQELKTRISELEQELRGTYVFDSIIGHDPKMVKILKRVAQVAVTDVPALILGESGTGKELIARALHFNSPRRDKPFIAINCAALPESLLESELFGHARGAFTGAVAEKKGWFETANGGTIFLDEISEMPPHLQVKLLRVLQTGEYSRVGDPKIRHADVRIISAASRDLQAMMQSGDFREEFYYRLNVVEFELPALRNRPGDIPLLVQHFLDMYCQKFERKPKKLSPTAEHLLLSYAYPGNIRELENIVQRAVVLSEGEIIHQEQFPKSVLQDALTDAACQESFKSAKQKVVENFEITYLENCLSRTHGNISQAARLARMDVKNFYMKMKKYNIQTE